MESVAVSKYTKNMKNEIKILLLTFAFCINVSYTFQLKLRMIPEIDQRFWRMLVHLSSKKWLQRLEKKSLKDMSILV